MKALFYFIKSKPFWISIGVAILLYLGAVFFTQSQLNGYTEHGQQISVPSLVGKELNEVDSILKANNLQYKILDEVYQEDATPGTVLQQEPLSYQSVKEQRTIYLTINALEAPKVELPNLINLSLRQAISTMEVLGFKLHKLEYRPDICVDCVLEVKMLDAKIEPGIKLRKGTEVTLVLGQGMSNEKVQIPYLIGKSVNDVVATLLSQSLNIGNVIYEKCKTKDDSVNARVLRQYPDFLPGEELQLGSEVDVWVTSDTASIVVINVDSLMLQIRGEDYKEPENEFDQ